MYRDKAAEEEGKRRIEESRKPGRIIFFEKDENESSAITLSGAKWENPKVRTSGAISIFFTMDVERLRKKKLLDGLCPDAHCGGLT